MPEEDDPLQSPSCPPTRYLVFYQQMPILWGIQQVASQLLALAYHQDPANCLQNAYMWVCEAVTDGKHTINGWTHVYCLPPVSSDANDAGKEPFRLAGFSLPPSRGSADLALLFPNATYAELKDLNQRLEKYAIIHIDTLHDQKLLDQAEYSQGYTYQYIVQIDSQPILILSEAVQRELGRVTMVLDQILHAPPIPGPYITSTNPYDRQVEQGPAPLQYVRQEVATRSQTYVHVVARSDPVRTVPAVVAATQTSTSQQQEQKVQSLPQHKQTTQGGPPLPDEEQHQQQQPFPATMTTKVAMVPPDAGIDQAQTQSPASPSRRDGATGRSSSSADGMLTMARTPGGGSMMMMVDQPSLNQLNVSPSSQKQPQQPPQRQPPQQQQQRFFFPDPSIWPSSPPFSSARAAAAAAARPLRPPSPTTTTTTNQQEQISIYGIPLHPNRPNLLPHLKTIQVVVEKLSTPPSPATTTLFVWNADDNGGNFCRGVRYMFDKFMTSYGWAGSLEDANLFVQFLLSLPKDFFSCCATAQELRHFVLTTLSLETEGGSRRGPRIPELDDHLLWHLSADVLMQKNGSVNDCRLTSPARSDEMVISPSHSNDMVISPVCPEGLAHPHQQQVHHFQQPPQQPLQPQEQRFQQQGYQQQQQHHFLHQNQWGRGRRQRKGITRYSP